MFIYLGKCKVFSHFKAMGADLMRIIYAYEKGLLTINSLEYNRAFTDVTVFLKNPHSFDFVEGDKYGLYLDRAGIACVWPHAIPHYIYGNTFTQFAPAEDTLVALGIRRIVYTSDSDDYDSPQSTPKPQRHVRLYNPDLESYSRSLDMESRADELDARAGVKSRAGSKAQKLGSRFMADPYDLSEDSNYESEDDLVLLGTKVRRR
jgi:hypothetical protein